ncbi:MAG: hypothetical protein AAGE92_00200 [Cyanobacteria bacterium P01_G01_bin.4]
MTYQLVNILEYIIPEEVEAEIHRHNWGAKLDELAKQHIVLGVLNRIPPCYQLLTPELLVCESRSLMSPVGAESMGGQYSSPTGEHMGSSTSGPKAAISPVSRERPSQAKTACSLAVEAMLPSHAMQELQTAIATEIAEQVTSIMAH